MNRRLMPVPVLTAASFVSGAAVAAPPPAGASGDASALAARDDRDHKGGERYKEEDKKIKSWF